MPPSAWRRLRLAVVFIDAASRYWLTVFPCVQREARRWRRCAEAIPYPELRRIALDTHRAERGNLEGAAAFAAFAPLRLRATVVRAVVAFQAIYDYVDSLAEQPADDPSANSRALHEALNIALQPSAPHGDYYRHQSRVGDGGYLHRLVDSCHAALRSLPSHPTIEPELTRSAARMIHYQVLVHAEETGSDLSAWAHASTSRETDLDWWESAAAAASSLGVFALIAAAAKPGLSTAEAALIARAYHPWIGALHVLLDSLIDQPHDERAGHHSLIAHYPAPDVTATRLAEITTAALTSLEPLPDQPRHKLLLAAMASFYLSTTEARRPHAAAAAERVICTLGDIAQPPLAILRARRLFGATRGVDRDQA